MDRRSVADDNFGYRSAHLFVELPHGKFATFVKFGHLGSGEKDKLYLLERARAAHLNVTKAVTCARLVGW